MPANVATMPLERIRYVEVPYLFDLLFTKYTALLFICQAKNESNKPQVKKAPNPPGAENYL